MDEHTLECLDFRRVCELLRGYALSGLGRGLAEKVQPVTRVALVRRWLAQVVELQRLVEERGGVPFGGISDVRDLLTRCAPPLQVTVEEMAQIRDTLDGTHAVAVYLRELPEDCPEFRHLAERVGDFTSIARRIDTVIDRRGQVRDDASPKLARLRQDIHEALGDIRGSVERLLNDANVRRCLQYPNHTFHGDRLVLPLRSEYRGRLPGIIHRTSDSGATIYVEPAEVVELNNRISSLRSEEQEEIGRLLWDLAHEVHLNSREIRRTLETLAVIDLVVAKVRFAKEFTLHCPQINEEGVLRVRNARHPLLLDLAREQVAAGKTPIEVVPIDYRLGEDFHLLLITGPNTGGKTVALKTVGLVCAMVQAGLPVPVDRNSEVPLYSHVLIDVGDEQSMQQSLSTFSGHLTRILDMLRKAGPRTLILLDELGAGTDPDEGAALGRAILDELLRMHCHGMVTTHLGALKSYALTRPGVENGCVDFDQQTLRPTYHLRIGEPGLSNALEIAQKLGMPKRMVGNARRYLSKKTRELHAAIAGTRHVKRQAEDARREAEEAQVAAGQAQTAAAAARARLEQQQRDFQEWVQRVVHLQAGDPVRVRNFDRDGKIVRLRLEQQRAEVDMGAFAVEVPLGDVLPPHVTPPPARATPAAVPPGRAERKERRRAAQSGSSAGSVRPRPAERPEPPAPKPLTAEQARLLQPQAAVYVKRFHREGRIVRVHETKGVAVVSVGALELEVPFDGLALPRDDRPAPRGRGNGRARGRNERQPAPDAAAPQPSASEPPTDAPPSA